MLDAKEEQIKILAKQLKIPTFAAYGDILRECSTNTDVSDILLSLLTTEAESRRENQNKRRLKAAAFPYTKTLDDFDFTQLNKSVSPTFIRELASCKFIDNHQNIIMVGNPGRGKTHLSIAIGLKACMLGYRVLFKNAGTLSTELAEARNSYQLGRIERALARTDLLILDEMGYMSFNKYESELLFKVISERSEMASTIVTTNLEFSKWTQMFDNAVMVGALVDRLTFHSHVLDMSGPSYRLLSSQSDVRTEKPDSRSAKVCPKSSEEVVNAKEVT